MEFKRISVKEAKALIDTNSPVIIDVRDSNSFLNGALPHAFNVTTSNFLKVKGQIPFSKDVLVYCYHGNSSQDMAQMFVDFGFSAVYSMDGGYEAWRLE